MSKMKTLLLLGVLVLCGAILLSACAAQPTVQGVQVAATGVPGPAGPPGPPGPQGPAGADAPVVEASAQIETCGVCHKEAGEKHQASYDDLYQDGVIQVSNLTYRFTPSPDTTIITFKMTKNGAPINGGSVENLAIYWVKYSGTAFEGGVRLSVKGEITYDPASGVTTSKLVEKEAGSEGYVDYSNVSNVNGLVVLYGRDETLGQLPARVFQTKYPFAAILETGAGVDYVSAANDAGCVKCHTDPYLKHGYIYGQVNNDPATDFLTCKACHLDDGEGEHYEWQLLVDDPVLAAAVLAGEKELTEEQHEQYAYHPSLMNDVHMSHAMEFPYPQSMANCVTCHEGKLDTVLADANFTVTTCKSCHPVTGVKGPAEGEEEPAYDTTKLALKTILPSPIHDKMDLETTDCLSCHAEGKSASTFKQIHTGYDDAIYTPDGIRYSEAITVTVDSASFDGQKLNIQFSAAQDPAIEGIDVASIQPTVMVGLYGWDTKDYIVGPHERPFDDNGDGAVDSKDSRALEFGVGEEHPRFTTESAAGGKWEVTADLSKWADLITDGTVKRVEIGILPALENADGVALAVNAATRTFDLGANAFADDFYSPIAKVVDGCDNCHGALATNFHSPSYGGNLVACRMCHITKSGGSHLEMQSRSLDSYIHAIHSSQAFDVGDINFADPVEALHYEHHVEFPYPTHGSTNCESCHVAGAYNVPDQAKSLPGLLSPSETTNGWDRNMGEVPAYVTGPAARACGGCHRAELINEDSYGGLVAFNQHIAQGGYLTEAGENPADTLAREFERVMEFFK